MRSQVFPDAILNIASCNAASSAIRSIMSVAPEQLGTNATANGELFNFQDDSSAKFDRLYPAASAQGQLLRAPHP